jgi:hypothetical protein
MRMLLLGHQPEQIHDIDEPDFDLRQSLAQNRHRRQRLRRRNIPGASHHHIGLRTLIIAGEIPYPDALGAMLHRIVH